MTTIKTAWGEVGHTVTVADVLSLRDALAARGRTGHDLRQSVRTEVKALLALQCPPPASTLTPEMVAARDRPSPLTHAEKSIQNGYQAMQVTEAMHEAYGAARAVGHLDVRDVKDAHHYAQKLHGMALWTEADRLIAEAGVT